MTILFWPSLNFGQVVMVTDLFPFANDSNPADFASLGTMDLFRGKESDIIGGELYITDGTAAGTLLVKNINATDFSTSSPTGMTSFNGSIWFSANDGIPVGAGNEIWVSDGTNAGTVLFLDINTISGNGNPEGFTVFGTNMYFSVNDGTNGIELWVTDGTVGGTVMLADINPAGNSNPSNFAVVGTELFFSADDGTNGEELWKTDGTLVGTVMVRNINPGAANSSPHDLIEMGGTLYFSATDGTNGRELWQSDGTFGGTSMVIDINGSGDGLTNVLGDTPTIGVINAELFFAASSTGLADMELWNSDGTAGGTAIFMIIHPTGSSLPAGFTNTSTELIFAATEATNGREIWTTDGTLANTMILSDIYPGSINSLPQEFGYNATSNNLYFRAENSNLVGAELWKYGPVVLSSEISYFNAIKIIDRAQLEWSTATETNHDKFIVERSSDGVDFQVIGEVQGAGNSFSTLTYNFVDDNPVQGINYYRLKQVDFDGKFDYSDIKTLNFEKEIHFKVYPNPFEDELFFELPTSQDQVIVRIHDMFGKLISIQHLMLEPRVKLQLDELKPGAYIISVQSSSRMFTETIIKL